MVMISNGNRNKSLSVQEYLNNIKPYLKEIITDLQKSEHIKHSIKKCN